jgi:hypothetical protein
VQRTGVRSNVMQQAGRMDSAEVRARLVEALKLDLIGP